jgi:hypothetical protein
MRSREVSAPELTAELDPLVEDLLLPPRARVGTAEPTASSSSSYPSGSFSDRAEGNLVYLENDGFGGDVDALAEFARSIPRATMRRKRSAAFRDAAARATASTASASSST